MPVSDILSQTSPSQ